LSVVTIGIPIYNAERTLPDVLRSVFAQSLQDWELIMVDDGSTDGSLLIAQSVKDGRVRVVTDGRNLGLENRLNQITQMARSPLIARMDADDLMHPERLAAQVYLLENHPELDAVDCGVLIIDGQGRPTGARPSRQLGTSPYEALQNTLMVHPSVTARAKWMLENPYDLAYPRAEDYELWVRTVARSQFSRIAVPLYFYREVGWEPFPFLRKYLKSAVSVRAAIRKHGPGLVGRRRVAQLLVRSYAKCLVFRACTVVGKQELLIRARSGELTPAERAEAEEIIRRVRATVVPGLESPALL